MKVLQSNRIKLFLLIILLNISNIIYAQQETYTQGVPQLGSEGITETTTDIMAREYLFGYHPPRNFEAELIQPDRTNLPQNPEALPYATWPPDAQSINGSNFLPESPQTTGVTFNGATGPTETGAFPPDVMGTAGPTQFIVFINGRLRSFNKSTGAADGILNVDPDNFFNTVMTPPGTGEITFTSDPNIRYDRLSERWFLTIIDVTVNSSTYVTTRANRILFAVSNGSIITGSTAWTFFQFQAHTNFADYPSLGIDADALYIGTDQFSLAGSFSNTNAYVIRKSSLLSGGPIVYTKFAGLLVSNVGPFAPRGVDNPDPLNSGTTALGYFIGADAYAYGKLTLRRILNPGGAPSISGNIALTVNTTSASFTVPHLGNTGGTSGYLDALDDRLFIARIRNGYLWTAHNINVNATGVAQISRSRDAARWYDITNLNTSPSIVQSGTVYNNAASNPRYYWIPSVTVSGQGHVAMGFSTAGAAERANAGTVGRLNTDASGLMRTPLLYTASSTAYNPSGDPGGSSGRRWGDYSFTCVDPNDDMTMWTIQEYCNGTNTYGVQVVQLLAPPPATPVTCNPPAVAPSLSSINVIVTGSIVSGSGFFDPGSDPGGPGFTNHISANISGGISVNSVIYNSPAQVTLNITTNSVPDGYYNVTITNPDGQSKTGTGIIQIDHSLPVELSSFTASISGNAVNLKWRTETEVNNYGFDIERSVFSNGGQENIWQKIGFAQGHGNSNSPKSYSYIDKSPAEGSNFLYRLKQIDTDGKFEYSKTIEVNLNTPANFELSQNYPNPFNPTTTIGWQSPTDGLQTIKVFNMLGKEVATLVNGYKPAGRYLVQFDAKDLPSGIYFYKIQAGNFSDVKKMILLK